MHKLISTLIIALALIIGTGQAVPAQAGEAEAIKGYIIPTEYGAQIMTDFPFIEQEINIICFDDGYCYLPVKMGDPTPQPN